MSGSATILIIAIGVLIMASQGLGIAIGYAIGRAAGQTGRAPTLREAVASVTGTRQTPAAHQDLDERPIDEAKRWRATAGRAAGSER